jgi:hypothetical protein
MSSSIPLNITQQFKSVLKRLNTFRTDGRQAFIENPPNNLSRILHDYSAERKSFIIWKDLLEERLT